MNSTKYLKGSCQHCGGHIEFPVELVGTTIDCPHCQKPTDLLLAAPKEQSGVPLKAIIWTGVALVILGLGLAGSMMALRRVQSMAKAKKLATQQQGQAAAKPADASAAPEEQPAPDPNDPAAQAGFRVSAITLGKASGTSLVYATGTIKNTADKQRFGIKIQLELFDAAGQKVGAATDYDQVLEPKGEWHFKALVVEPKAVSAKLVSVKEQ
jgi:hypothetical protein